MKTSPIKTERLELVPQALKYLESTHAYTGDKEITRLMLFLPNETLEETKNFLIEAEKEWQREDQEIFEWAILRDGEHIGGISIELLKEDKTKMEFGWCLRKGVQGHGYAVEAASALVEWAKNVLGVTSFIAHCDTENIASWKTMEKLGMKRKSCTGGRFNRQSPTVERQEYLYEMNISNQ